MHRIAETLRAHLAEAPRPRSRACKIFNPFASREHTGRKAGLTSQEQSREVLQRHGPDFER